MHIVSVDLHIAFFLIHFPQCCRRCTLTPNPYSVLVFFPTYATAGPNCNKNQWLQKHIGKFIFLPYLLTYNMCYPVTVNKKTNRKRFTLLLEAAFGAQNLHKSLPPQLNINVNLFLCFDRNLGKSGLRVSCLGLGEIMTQSEKQHTWWICVQSKWPFCFIFYITFIKEGTTATSESEKFAQTFKIFRLTFYIMCYFRT